MRRWSLPVMHGRASRAACTHIPSVLTHLLLRLAARRSQPRPLAARQVNEHEAGLQGRASLAFRGHARQAAGATGGMPTLDHWVSTSATPPMPPSASQACLDSLHAAARLLPPQLGLQGRRPAHMKNQRAAGQRTMCKAPCSRLLQCHAALRSIPATAAGSPAPQRWHLRRTPRGESGGHREHHLAIWRWGPQFRPAKQLQTAD